MYILVCHQFVDAHCLSHEIDVSCYYDKSKMMENVYTKCKKLFLDNYIDVKYCKNNYKIVSIVDNRTYKVFHNNKFICNKKLLSYKFLLAFDTNKTCIFYSMFEDEFNYYGSTGIYYVEIPDIELSKNNILQQEIIKYNSYIDLKNLKYTIPYKNYYCIMKFYWIENQEADVSNVYKMIDIIEENDIYNLICKINSENDVKLNDKYTKLFFEKNKTFDFYLFNMKMDKTVTYIKTDNAYIIHIEDELSECYYINAYLMIKIDEYSRIMNENMQLKSYIDELKSYIPGGNKYEVEKAKFEKIE